MAVWPIIIVNVESLICSSISNSISFEFILLTIAAIPRVSALVAYSTALRLEFGRFSLPLSFSIDPRDDHWIEDELVEGLDRILEIVRIHQQILEDSRVLILHVHVITQDVCSLIVFSPTLILLLPLFAWRRPLNPIFFGYHLILNEAFQLESEPLVSSSWCPPILALFVPSAQKWFYHFTRSIPSIVISFDLILFPMIWNKLLHRYLLIRY